MDFFIKNRQNLKIFIKVTTNKNSKGLVFILHGLSGNQEQKHIMCFEQVCLDSGYTVVKFDATNTFGKSEGSYNNITATNYIDDLEDVICWASKQDWYIEPFVLIGHSLGGLSISYYAANHSDKVKAMAPIATVVSGGLYLASYSYKQLIDWQNSGWHRKESKSRPGFIKELSWKFAEDIMQYDLLSFKFSIPVLLIVGEKDLTTNPTSQFIFYKSLQNSYLNKFNIIKDAPHTFINDNHLVEISTILSDWLKII